MEEAAEGCVWTGTRVSSSPLIPNLVSVGPLSFTNASSTLSPSSAAPTRRHLKSHLQKFRLGKQPHREHSIKDTNRASMLDLQRNTVFSPGIISHNTSEMQMEVQRRIHEQIEVQVQRHLHLRIEAQSMLEKACQTQATLKGGHQPLLFQYHHLNPYDANDGNKSSVLWVEEPSSSQLLGSESVGKDIDSTLHLYDMKPNFSEDAPTTHRTPCLG
ncbi:PREDICTED: myb family transcription factor PHL12 [Tarenaya hassleriana]|uniref:myb family transcription factor PHL12 n=1 Tax=Tarenaya hassleriana TaxID=28532 RepID=UPI0008FD61F7|nr:PREDICTED: myb family transcription factor PHL12 [Tarenaya hassleriana]